MPILSSWTIYTKMHLFSNLELSPKRAGLYGPILQRGGGGDSAPLRSRKPIDETSSVWY